MPTIIFATLVWVVAWLATNLNAPNAHRQNIFPAKIALTTVIQGTMLKIN